MSELRIPTVLAVGLWFAGALAVGTYTWIAIKETASASNTIFANAMIAEGQLVANTGGMLAAQAAAKSLERGKFKPSK